MSGRVDDAPAVPASAATTIAVDSVVQRWPWNNKVDITYTAGDGQDVANGVYRRIVFTATIGGRHRGFAVRHTSGVVPVALPKAAVK